MRLTGIAFVLCLLCLSAPVYAQVLPGATITATGLETGVQTIAVSDGRGEYRLKLAPGTYKLQVELAGFGPVLIPKVELLVGQNATVPEPVHLAEQHRVPETD